MQSTLRCRICVCFPPDFYSLANIADRLKTVQGILSCMNSPLALAKTCSNFYAFCSMPAHAHWPDGNCRACSGYGRWGNMMPCSPLAWSSNCCMLSAAVKIRRACHAGLPTCDSPANLGIPLLSRRSLRAPCMPVSLGLPIVS